LRSSPGRDFIYHHIRVWRSLLHTATQPLREQKGATTAEYALLLALIVVMLIGALSSLGEALRDKLLEIVDSLTSA